MPSQNSILTPIGLSAAAAIAAFAVGVVLIPLCLPLLTRLKFGQNIRTDGPASHHKKSGTPTMGGIMIVLAFLAGVAAFWLIGRMAWADMGGGHRTHGLIVVIAVVGFGLVGFLDDFIKIRRKSSRGLRAWQKLAGQCVVCVPVLVLMWQHSGSVIIPFAGISVFLGAWWFPFGLLVFLSASNGANLTDGLDGLAGGVTAIIAVFFIIAAMLTGPGAAGIAPVAGALLGALLAFLCFNSHPSRVFMGDTGSLALGGFVAAMALLLGLPLFLLFVAVVYVAESVSVILQVVHFKRTGRRLFRMAPLHHHFELRGVAETKIVSVFCVVTVLGVLVGVLGLVF